MTIYKESTNMFSVIIIMSLLILFCNGDQFVVNNITSVNNPESTTINVAENLEKEYVSTFTYINTLYTETTTPASELDNFPKDCSQRQKRKNLYRHKNSRLKKCCPIGESLSMSEENQSGAMCGSANLQFTPNLINVTLFDNCIEDMETEYTLPLEIGNPCNTIHIPLNKKKSKLITSLYFGFYCIMSLIGAVILVILTIQKGLPGMPSYFIQGYTESIRESQRYFIPPVSTLLLFSFIVMASAFFGFQKLKSQGVIVNSNDEDLNNPLYDENIFQEVKKDAKCISLLGLILISTWLLEIVTFYSPGPQIYLILMDMINGLQGVFVLLIFLVIRRRRTIIFRWWNDRGSHTIEKIELNSI
ncbi:probable G-protein coupled receptor Mth-like 14 isoform X5 [Lucilia cuprina]|uniref:probable G-protein coupled receptor Mth-like 14 isoform X5 n=1 Tax=Lucilia cuprina TaxID=7375 RepID=UPI001F060FBE|nr:probable G-protein coupled receptor Mth-like 14 isoform X5 [Lucilia cuprina]